MKARYIILIAVTCLVILLGLAAVLFVFRTTRPDMNRLKTDFRIQAAELYQDFESDEPAALDRYSGKILEVTGVLETVEKDLGGNRILILLDPLFGVSCTIDSLQSAQHGERLNSLRSGDTVTVKGRCDGMLTDVKMVGCILKSGQ